MSLRINGVNKRFREAFPSQSHQLSAHLSWFKINFHRAIEIFLNLTKCISNGCKYLSPEQASNRTMWSCNRGRHDDVLDLHVRTPASCNDCCGWFLAYWEFKKKATLHSTLKRNSLRATHRSNNKFYACSWTDMLSFTQIWSRSHTEPVPSLCPPRWVHWFHSRSPCQAQESFKASRKTNEGSSAASQCKGVLLQACPNVGLSIGNSGSWQTMTMSRMVVLSMHETDIILKFDWGPSFRIVPLSLRAVCIAKGFWGTLFHAFAITNISSAVQVTCQVCQAACNTFLTNADSMLSCSCAMRDSKTKAILH